MQGKQIQIRLWTPHSKHTRKAPWERHETNTQIFFHIWSWSKPTVQSSMQVKCQKIKNIRNKRKHFFSRATLSDQNIISLGPFSIS